MKIIIEDNNKINKAKATFTWSSPRNTKAGHEEGNQPKLGVDISALKGERHVMREMI
jgi:hypothetical protein